MPILKSKIPSYCRHKASNQAYVTIDGQRIYLGLHDSKASHVQYDEVINQWLANGRQLPEQQEDPTINELIVPYVQHAQTNYVKNGKVTDEVAAIKSALRVLKSLYGTLPAIEFGPKKLEVVRDGMIQVDWSRKHINKQISRIKRMFRWCVRQELVPGSIFENLQSLEGLKRGRSDARETAVIRPIGLDVVEITLAKMHKIPADLVRLQLLTGCRPGEVCSLKPKAVDRSGDVWIFRPETHKTEHHDQQ